MIDILEKWDLNSKSNLILEKRFNLFDKIKSFVRPEDQAEYFISFTDVKGKLGINPQFSSGGTPVGVYGYPLTPKIFEQFINNQLPYGQDRKYISIGKINLNNKKMGVFGGYNQNETSFKDVYDDILNLLNLSSRAEDNKQNNFISDEEKKFLNANYDYNIKTLNEILIKFKSISQSIAELIFKVVSASSSAGEVYGKIEFDDLYKKIIQDIDNLRSEIYTSFSNSNMRQIRQYYTIQISDFVNDLNTRSKEACLYDISMLTNPLRRFINTHNQEDSINFKSYKNYYLDEKNLNKFFNSIFSAASGNIRPAIELNKLLKNISSESVTLEGLKKINYRFRDITNTSKNSSMSDKNMSFKQKQSPVLNPESHEFIETSNLPLSTLWQLAYQLARDSASNKFSKNIGIGEMIAVTWSKILMKLGYGAFIDYGSGAIHSAEDSQILLFPGSYEYLGQFENDIFKSRETQSKWRDSIQNQTGNAISITNTSIKSSLFLDPPFNGLVRSNLYIRNSNFKSDAEIGFSNVIFTKSNINLSKGSSMRLTGKCTFEYSPLTFSGGDFSCSNIVFYVEDLKTPILICNKYESQVEKLLDDIEINYSTYNYDNIEDEPELLYDLINSFNLSDSEKINYILFDKIFTHEHEHLVDYYREIRGHGN